MERDRRLIVQSYRILSEQVCPYYVNGNEHQRGKEFWSDIHSRLSMELGLKSLSPTAYSYQNVLQGKAHTVTGMWGINMVCENWALKPFDGTSSADRFIKERLSLIEVGFRTREEEIKAESGAPAEDLALWQTSRIRLPGDPAAGSRAWVAKLKKEFQACVDELNARFRQCEYDLNYHNGFIQRSSDPLVGQIVEKAFWSLVSEKKWKNVETDMIEALDRRDSATRDPAFYAARSLESTIKIISDERGWSHGKENGAHSYIDNLASKKNGFISAWEASALKEFFTKVRNPLGHGPGTEPMPTLNEHQTNWAIETCMIWIKSLIRRM